MLWEKVDLPYLVYLSLSYQKSGKVERDWA